MDVRIGYPVRALMRRTPHLRGLPWRLALPLVACLPIVAWTVAQEHPAAAVDKSLYRTPMPLDTWIDPAELTASWQGKRVFLTGVFLIAETHRENEIYATSCAGELALGDLQNARCPRVYLGKLPWEEARRRLQQVGSREVDVYLTVGPPVPRRFVPQFGMFGAEDGAWVEIGTDMFHIEADARVFRVPEEREAGDRVADEAAEPAPPAPPPSTPAEAQAYLSFGYRLHLENEAGGGGADLRAIERTSLLSGNTELVVETSAPDWLSVEGIEVFGQEGIYLHGGPHSLCRSTTPVNSCVADFGTGIAGQRFRIDADVRLVDGERLTLSREFATLDTHPSRLGTASPAVYREQDAVERPPPDEVVRLVRVETVTGRGEGRRVEYRLDLPPEVFRIDVAGIKGASIRSVTPPAAARPGEQVPLLIPIFFSVSPYFTERRQGGFGWREAYAGDGGGIVRKLCQGLERAAWNGVDAEFIVIDYAATARMFGPFRLHPGKQLSDAQKRDNRGTLEALEAHLRQPPLPAWQMRLDKWISDLSSPLHAMNDLYFRTYPGLVSALLVTDGWNNPEHARPRFQLDLWPERIDRLNRAISPARAEAILGLLDRGRSLHHEALDRFLATAGDGGELAPESLAACIRGLDPGGASTLHPHRENRLPPMDALVIPSPVSLRTQMQEMFSTMIRDDFGGDIYRLYTVSKAPAERLEEQIRDRRQFGATLSFGQMIGRIHDQLRASYIVVAEIPNEKQNGARHPLRFEAVETYETSRGKTKRRPVEGRLRYMPYYTSSISVREKLPVLAGSPFALLRLLAAFELRNHWDDGDLYAVLDRRLAVERDPVVRDGLLESAVAINLKRLQITPLEIPDEHERLAHRRQAYQRLQALAENAADLAGPSVVRDAAHLARTHQVEPLE
jgi:hypothetical protein